MSSHPRVRELVLIAILLYLSHDVISTVIINFVNVVESYDISPSIFYVIDLMLLNLLMSSIIFGAGGDKEDSMNNRLEQY